MAPFHVTFIAVCCTLYTFHSKVFNPFATEVTVFGSDCPSNITGLSTFPLSALDGEYKAIKFYSEGSVSDQCYKIRFTPISKDRTDVSIGYKTSIGLPFHINFRFLPEKINGTFQIMDSITGAVPFGEAYILANGTAIIYYSCRAGLQGLLKSHSSEVLVLTKNDTITWTPEDDEWLIQTLETNDLQFGLMKTVEQGYSTCNSIKV